MRFFALLASSLVLSLVSSVIASAEDVSPLPTASPSVLPSASPAPSPSSSVSPAPSPASAAAPVANTATGPAVTIEKLQASVNSNLILFSDVLKFRETLKLRAQLDPLFPGTRVASEGEKSSDQNIVDFLIDEKIIAQQFPVTDTEVEQEINSIQANNHIDRAQLQRALTEQGFSFDQYFELIRVSVSKRNLIDRDIRTKVTISDDDIKNYFYNHYARNTAVPMAYKLRVISVSLKNYKSVAGARETAQSALKAIRSGEPFEDVAKRVSDDSNAENGGDLGVVTEDQVSPAIRDQVKKLRIGQVSDVFGGAQNGAYEILKLEDVKSAESERLEKMKDEIRNQLTTSEYQHQISLWLERERLNSFIHRAGDPTIAGLPIAPADITP
jgi:peptidyl-prolyl cis-trans isomerase SurA